MSEPLAPELFAYRRPAELDGPATHHPIVILGAGPVGLALAIDLALHDVPCVIIDAKAAMSDGSRAICWAKRSLEICDRLGTADALVAKGVTWNEGEVYVGDRVVYNFHLQPEPDHKRPAFINLQQFYFEEEMINRAKYLPSIDLRWQNEAIDLRQNGDIVELDIRTPDGTYTLTTDWLVAADGVRSLARKALSLDFEGRVFQDRFLISDIRMKSNVPAVRRFWFSPTFFEGQSALMYKQAKDVWRVDFQLGWDADPDEEQKPENVLPRLQKMLGDAVDFEIVWTSVYTFTCRRLEKFRHGRVLFAGDSAHVVSPFGARGGNSGLQDADNLGWKLAAVITGNAPETLIDSYDAERVPATDENILNSTRSTDFMTPKTNMSRVFRDAVLELAAHHPFARRFVNSGRLSVPAHYAGSSLNTPDTDAFESGPAPGSPMIDAPNPTSAHDWLVDALATSKFTAVTFGTRQDLPALPNSIVRLHIEDLNGIAARRYGAKDGTCYLIRPDQHIAARWHNSDAGAIGDAHSRALAQL